ncbi:P-loop containing nucleoside triphosphate hydrolase protein [Xylariaceae sp. FL0255]|nr:P-loop containing nucleoside triphosphate hydrolase protein [Xylariaceae sp. FL0255]
MKKHKEQVVLTDDDDASTASSQASIAPHDRLKRSTIDLNDWGDESDAPSEAQIHTRKKRRQSKKSKNKDSEANTVLPVYAQKRRTAFDQDTQHALRTPPDYRDIYFSDDENLAEIDEKPRFDLASGVKPCRPYQDIHLPVGLIPASVAQYLRDYQVKGVSFLYDLFLRQTGGILGDDMGLGKTVQVAAFLTVAFGKTGDSRDAKRMRKYRRAKNDWYPRVLIVCPGSLIYNWKNELERWGWWVADLYHGTKRNDVLDAAKSGRLEVMITTYNTYKNSANDINIIPWDVVIADECHCIKDPSAGISRSMNLVNALCRIGLTGTAIQNNFNELWALLNWTNPGRFSNLTDWKRTITTPLTVGQSHDATFQQLSLGRSTAKRLVENILSQFLLRRLKSLIADQLPKKTDKVVFCPLSDLQREAYQNIISSPIAKFVLSSFEEECDCGSGLKRGFCCYKVNVNGESWKALTFPLIMSLQKLSNHFNLIIPQTAANPDQYSRELRILQAAAPDSWEREYSQRASLLKLSDPDYCGKWKILSKLLKFFHENGDKVLVFSHSVKLLHILQQLFRNTSYNVSYLDGSLAYEERQAVVDDFNCDPNQFIFLISTKVGGVGLNITSANKVVIMDPHWNPSYDLQAQDRAYRIGQMRDVDVYRLISVGTIEEITYARQIYKQQQANIGYSASNERRYFKGVQNHSTGELFGLRNLLTYNGDQGVLRDIVNKTNVAEARAGVRMMDVDMNEAARFAEDALPIKREAGADDESGGLRQLSNFLTASDSEKKKLLLDVETTSKPKSDPIQAILADAGVDYTHENSEVIGSSKVENELSRWAEKALESNMDAGERVLFINSQQGRRLFCHEYNPPKEVMQRQFCTMAKEFGFRGATEFALAVESMTQEQRRNCLDVFYERRIKALEASDNVKVKDETSDVRVKDEVETEPDDVKVKDEMETESEPEAEEASVDEPAKADMTVEDVCRAPLDSHAPGEDEDKGKGVQVWDDEETDEL